MCEFISWVEKKGAKGNKILFLTDALLKTPKGKSTLIKYGDNICGHSAVRFYFGLGEGVERFEAVDKECDDFTTPDNFPSEIVKIIKEGGFAQIGRLPDAVFTNKGLKRVRADAKWKEAAAKLEEAAAKIKEAYAKWKEAAAKLKEADAKLEEADAKLEEADAKLKEADAKIKWLVFADPLNRIKAWR